MKYLISLVIYLSVFVFQRANGQDSTTQIQLSQLLSDYYGIKDALVAGNGSTASLKAEEFIKTANGIDYKIISEGNINALLKDATPISESPDIKKQRVHFANLSTNMAELAKAMRFTDKPVYKAYCPMKKASWLSNDKAIRNPYYGSAMLTCGNVVEIFDR
jgi:hypothetical protein